MSAGRSSVNPYQVHLRLGVPKINQILGSMYHLGVRDLYSYRGTPKAALTLQELGDLTQGYLAFTVKNQRSSDLLVGFAAEFKVPPLLALEAASGRPTVTTMSVSFAAKVSLFNMPKAQPAYQRVVPNRCVLKAGYLQYAMGSPTSSAPPPEKWYWVTIAKDVLNVYEPTGAQKTYFYLTGSTRRKYHRLDGKCFELRYTAKGSARFCAKTDEDGNAWSLILKDYASNACDKLPALAKFSVSATTKAKFYLRNDRFLCMDIASEPLKLHSDISMTRGTGVGGANMIKMASVMTSISQSWLMKMIKMILGWAGILKPVKLADLGQLGDHIVTKGVQITLDATTNTIGIVGDFRTASKSEVEAKQKAAKFSGNPCL